MKTSINGLLASAEAMLVLFAAVGLASPEANSPLQKEHAPGLGHHARHVVQLLQETHVSRLLIDVGDVGEEGCLPICAPAKEACQYKKARPWPMQQSSLATGE